MSGLDQAATNALRHQLVTVYGLQYLWKYVIAYGDGVRLAVPKAGASPLERSHFNQQVRDYLAFIDANETDSVAAAERGLNDLYWKIRNRLLTELYEQRDAADSDYRRRNRK